MDYEAKIRKVLEEEWGIDFSNNEQTLWVGIHKHEDGYRSMGVLEATPSGNGVSLRVYRAFPLGEAAGVSMDIVITGETATSSNLDDFLYNNGEQGKVDVTKERQAIMTKLSGDVVFLWHHDEAPFFSFVARTVAVGGVERLVCGQCELKGSTYSVQIDFDEPLAEVVEPKEAVSVPRPM